MQGYGMTEASPVILMTPEGNTRYASTGVAPGSTECKIVPLSGDDSKGVGPRTTGELCVRGPQVMSGYLNNKEANEVTFYPGNWLRTGDVAFYDEDGYFYITDRMKELIKVKGFQVPPAELEAVLRDHPKILEAAVFGIPHELNGEAPRAIVVLRQNEVATAEEIADYVAERVAHYKKLEGVSSLSMRCPRIRRAKYCARISKKSIRTEPSNSQCCILYRPDTIASFLKQILFCYFFKRSFALVSRAQS